MWSIPDKGEGVNDIQSILFQEYLDALVVGVSGLDCVVSGLAVTGNANLLPSVSAGTATSNGALFAVSGSTVTISTADATNPRLDLIVVTSAGALAVRAGTAAAAPKPPARTANDVLLAVAYVPAAATSLATANFIDLRVVPILGKSRQHAFVSTGTGTDYFGSATVGTATTTALWTIKKIALSNAGAATVTTATNVQWVDYLTATYS